MQKTKSMNHKLRQTLERRRQTAMQRPLTQREISVLMSIYAGSQPLFPSVEMFYTEDYKRLLKAKMHPIGKDELARLCSIKNKDGSNKYRTEDFRTADGKLRTLTEQEARDLLGLEEVVKYRPATPEEANILYCDIYSRVVKEGLERENV